MAHYGTKGFFIKELKKAGITKHPVDQKKLETHKTHVVRALYFENVEVAETTEA